MAGIRVSASLLICTSLLLNMDLERDSPHHESIIRRINWRSLLPATSSPIPNMQTLNESQEEINMQAFETAFGIEAGARGMRGCRTNSKLLRGYQQECVKDKWNYANLTHHESPASKDKPRFGFVPKAKVLNLTGKIQMLGPHPFAQGGHADIFRGRGKLKNDLPIEVAIKVIRSCGADTTHYAQLRRKFTREIQVWTGLNHPNVATFFGICYDLGRPDAPCLISTYYPNGNVTEYIQQHPTIDRMQLISQAAAGLCYLHSAGVGLVHGDIKAANILVDDQGEACLSDFGLARVLECSGFTTGPAGSARWMAPELIVTGYVCEAPRVTTKTDVWAFAMTILEILTGQFPFPYLKYESAVIFSVKNGDLPRHNDYPDISADVWFVLQQCWSFDPWKRPSMRALSLLLNVITCSDAHSLSKKQKIIRHILDRYSRNSLPTSTRRRTISLPVRMAQSINCSELKSAPYPCLWRGCNAKFSMLKDCQIHELNHVDTEMSSDLIASTLPPSYHCVGPPSNHPLWS